LFNVTYLSSPSVVIQFTTKAEACKFVEQTAGITGFLLQPVPTSLELMVALMLEFSNVQAGGLLQAKELQEGSGSDVILSIDLTLPSILPIRARLRDCKEKVEVGVVR
jgi:hypothetical protein